MKAKCIPFLGIFVVLLICWSAYAEVSYQVVALNGWPAPGLANNAKFASFKCFSLANDERVAFTASTTDAQFNRVEGIWAGLPVSLNLLAHAGESAPGAGPGVTFYYFDSANINDCRYVAFIADLQGQGVDTNNPGSFWVAAAEPSQVADPLRMIVPEDKVTAASLEAKSYLGYCNSSSLIQCGNLVACGVHIGDTFDQAILAGPENNWVLVGENGSPAPGTTNNFGNIASDSDKKSLTPDGKIAFSDSLDNFAGGIWFGPPDAVQPVVLSGQPVPASLLGGGYTFGSFSGNEVEANGNGELAFPIAVYDTNFQSSSVLLAGPPGGFRVVAQSGQPAPGIPGATFTNINGSLGVFGDAVIGADGSVAFVASFSDTGNDFGLWFAPKNGAPRLIARSDGSAPGAGSGVVFKAQYQYLPPFDEFYMNARDQIAFHAALSGPGVGSTNSSGIWLADPDGTVSLIARSGDTVAGHKLAFASLGYYAYEPPNVAGPEDGRRTPINDRGDILFSSGDGLFIARNGIVVNASVVGSGVRLTFPTLAGKHYRVDSKSSLSAPWSVLVPSVNGTGDEVTVTNPVPSTVTRFYRVARTD